MAKLEITISKEKFEGLDESLKGYYVTNQEGQYELEGIGAMSRAFSAEKKETERLTNEQKTAKAEADRLTKELSESRIEVGKLSGEVAKATAGAIPTGYVAVKKSEAETIKALTDKGLTVDQVVTQLDELDALKGKVTEFELDKSIKAFAETEKIENVEALSGLIKKDGVIPVVKEVDENGKKVSRGFLSVTEGDKTEDTPYKDYLEANWKPFEASLRTTEKKRTVAIGSDPKAVTSTGDDEEMAKQAAAGQARATHSAF